MTRCILIEPSQWDTTGLQTYGEEVVLFPPNCRRPSIWTPGFAKAVIDELKVIDYDPNVDYLVIVGHMVPMVIATAAMVAKYGRLQVLCFSSTERVYVPREIGAQEVPV